MDKIQELEKKLRYNRDKIVRLHEELQMIEAEINELKSRGIQTDTSASVRKESGTVSVSQQTAQPVTQPASQQTAQPASQPVMQPVSQQTAQPVMQPVSQTRQGVQPQPVFQQSIQPKTQQDYDPYGLTGAQNSHVQPRVPYQPPTLEYKKSDTESLVGRNVMGVAASVLIFISIILFATLLIPMLTDGIKITIMLVVSFGITAVGLFKWFPKKESAFFLSLAACGIGAIYISLFICNAYFHVINEYVLYILILFWAGGVLYLSRYKQRLFEIIGLSGIIISVVFGTILCVNRNDMGMFIILTIYFIVGTTAYLIFRLKDEISYIISTSASLVGAIVLIVGMDSLIDKSLSAISGSGSVYLIIAILGIYMIAMIVLNLIKVDENNKLFIPIVGIIYNILLDTMLFVGLGKEDSTNIIVLFISLVVYAVIEALIHFRQQLGKEKSISFSAWQVILTIIITSMIFSTSVLSKTIGLPLLVIPLILYGFMRDDSLSKVLGIIYYGIMIWSFEVNSIYQLIIVIGVFILINVLLYMKKNQYSTGIKCAGYNIFIVGLIVSIAYVAVKYRLDAGNILMVILYVIGILNVLVVKSGFGKNWLTQEEEEPITISGYVINALMMLFSLYLMHEVNDDILHFLAVIGAIALFFVNTANFLKSEESGAGIYVGIKFTVLVLSILISYSAPNYVLSIATFVLAIVIILVGFWQKIKILRLYGLVTSMICVVKLVMIDITYDNTAGHALSFFISGVLCFVISALYNIADKKMKESDLSDGYNGYVGNAGYGGPGNVPGENNQMEDQNNRYIY